LITAKSFLSKFSRPASSIKTSTMSNRPVTVVPMTSSSSMSASGTPTTFSLEDGQTYEIVGEVGTEDVVQGAKGEAIEIIEVDEETMARLTAQNAGMTFQNSGTSGIQIATLDPSDPNINQILKAINPTEA